MGEAAAETISSPSSDGSFQVTVPVSVRPGLNEIKATVNREQEGEGDNSVVVEDFAVQ